MGWQVWAGIGLVAILLYTVIPDLFLHHLGIGSFKGHLGAGASLTFDDGPDPDYTVRLLDKLDQYQVKAVFFLVGEKAEKYPALVREILGRGHQIGLHGYVHQHAWLMGPWKTWRTWSKGRKILEGISGRPIEWVRPPWGVFNLMTFIWFRRQGLTAVLWTAEGKDWKEMEPDLITQRILKRIDEGAIIDLHDGARHPGAPECMLAALEGLITGLVQVHKIPVVPLKLPDYPITRQLLLRLWNTWERYYARSAGIRRIGPDNIYRISTARYDGPELKNDSGRTLARPGDRIGELHLNNIRMQSEETEPARIAVGYLRKIRGSMPGVARYIQASPDYEGIQAFASVTLLNRGLKGLGFKVEELPLTWNLRRIGLVQKMILRVYHPAGNRQKMGQPKLVWISTEDLLKNWLPKTQGAEPAGEVLNRKQPELITQSITTTEE